MCLKTNHAQNRSDLCYCEKDSLEFLILILTIFCINNFANALKTFNFFSVMNMNSKQVTLHFYNVRNQNTSSFEKKCFFCLYIILKSNSCLSFNRSNKTEHVPT